MSLARVIASPTSFNNTNLRKVDLGYTQPLPGALYDWATDRLPLGALSAWKSLVGGEALIADGGSPSVVSSGNVRALKFDGVANRMRIPLSVASPHTVVAVYRLVAPAGNQTVHFGYAGTGAGALSVDAAGTTVRAASATGFIVPTPELAPDSNWHVSVLSINGASSGLRIDNADWVGNLGAATRDGITIGFAAGTPNRTPIEFKRLAILNGSRSVSQRAGLQQLLSHHYSI